MMLPWHDDGHLGRLIQGRDTAVTSLPFLPSLPCLFPPHSLRLDSFCHPHFALIANTHQNVTVLKVQGIPQIWQCGVAVNVRKLTVDTHTLLLTKRELCSSTNVGCFWETAYLEECGKRKCIRKVREGEGSL